ncbi:armadillo repeat-containing protein 10 isoform X2 [Nyctibius grandis]|uniref:armadillo repeat-containing protein 10 isoform X2 n=1 Tax=Nyctibius grandis TaxID=48427 RepID=UPI0035BC6802
MGRWLPRAMGEPRAAAVRAVAAVVLGAGACYCLWRLAAGGRRGQQAAAGAARGPPSDNSPPVSTHTMDADALQKLIHLLQATDDPLIQEQALITLSNSAAFSVNQDIIRNLDGLFVIGGMLSDCIPKVKEKALNALSNLSMNIKNQEEIQIQVLKVLVNLSANPAMTRHLLKAQVPSFLLLFDNYINRDILLRALTFAANLKKNVNNEGGTMIQDQYSEDSVFFTLCRDSTPFAQKLASLLHHPDTEVKEQVVRILTQ